MYSTITIMIHHDACCYYTWYSAVKSSVLSLKQNSKAFGELAGQESTHWYCTRYSTTVHNPTQLLPSTKLCWAKIEMPGHLCGQASITAPTPKNKTENEVDQIPPCKSRLRVQYSTALHGTIPSPQKEGRSPCNEANKKSAPPTRHPAPGASARRPRASRRCTAGRGHPPKCRGGARRCAESEWKHLSAGGRGLGPRR